MRENDPSILEETGGEWPWAVVLVLSFAVYILIAAAGRAVWPLVKDWTVEPPHIVSVRDDLGRWRPAVGVTAHFPTEHWMMLETPGTSRTPVIYHMGPSFYSGRKR